MSVPFPRYPRTAYYLQTQGINPHDVLDDGVGWEGYTSFKSGEDGILQDPIEYDTKPKYFHPWPKGFDVQELDNRMTEDRQRHYGRTTRTVRLATG